MHVTLGGIISKHTRDNDRLLTFVKPAIGPEPLLGLSGGGRHHEERGETDGKRYKTPINLIVRRERESVATDLLYQEKPSPAGSA